MCIWYQLLGPLLETIVKLFCSTVCFWPFLCSELVNVPKLGPDFLTGRLARIEAYHDYGTFPTLYGALSISMKCSGFRVTKRGDINGETISKSTTPYFGWKARNCGPAPVVQDAVCRVVFSRGESGVLCVLLRIARPQKAALV